MPATHGQRIRLGRCGKFRRWASISLLLLVCSAGTRAEPAALGEANERLYRVTVRERGAVVKEHLATLHVAGSEVVLRSTTKGDYRFVPEQHDASARGLAEGAWRAFIKDRPLFYPGTPVRVRAVSDGLVVDTPNAMSIELTELPPGRSLAFTEPWQSPFHPSSTYPTTGSRVASPFGAGRTSFHTRHLHTGVDLEGAAAEPVYAIGAGVVEFVSHWEFEGTVVVRHALPSGGSVFSKYVHVRDPTVHAGEKVTAGKMLARLFNAAEFGKSGFKHNHLHLELRKDYSDLGHASTHSRNAADLQKCCIDPVTVLPR